MELERKEEKIEPKRKGARSEGNALARGEA
jgi:hypothetical protein